MEADEKSAYYMCKLVGPNMENFEKKFYRQCKLGWGPNMEADEKSTSISENIKTLTKNMQTITST